MRTGGVSQSRANVLGFDSTICSIYNQVSVKTFLHGSRAVCSESYWERLYLYCLELNQQSRVTMLLCVYDVCVVSSFGAPLLSFLTFVA